VPPIFADQRHEIAGYPAIDLFAEGLVIEEELHAVIIWQGPVRKRLACLIHANYGIERRM
jgi:hypothetical protein